MKSLFKYINVALILLMLSACVQSTKGPWNGNTQSHPPATPSDTPQKDATLEHPVKVALLVPLTGNGSDIGKAILNASQLAIFDMAPKGFQIIPRDTKGTPIGAQIATQEAISSGADFILGPLFSGSVKSSAAAASPHNINVVGFTTDRNAVSYNSFAMGFIPSTQVNSVLNYAISQGKKKFSIVIKDSQYGTIIESAVRKYLLRYGLEEPHIHKIYGQSTEIHRLYQGAVSNNSQAILIATDMGLASNISTGLIENGLTNHKLQRLGLGLWDDTKNTYSVALEGAWFATASPTQRSRFTKIYSNTYGTQPPRLASMGYDATALAISLSKSGNGYSRSALVQPNGFYGLDGIFRFHKNGLVERGLAIMEFSRGRTIIRKDAPKSFNSGL